MLDDATVTRFDRGFRLTPFRLYKWFATRKAVDWTVARTSAHLPMLPLLSAVIYHQSKRLNRESNIAYVRPI